MFFLANKNCPGLAPIRRADDAVAFHCIEQTGSASVSDANVFHCGLGRATWHSMRPSGSAPSVLSTVGRCVAESPSLPFVTSVANGRHRISARRRDRWLRD